MSKNEIEARVERLQRYEAEIEALKEEADAIKDSLKDEMELRGVETLHAGRFIIRWTSVLTSKLDTKRMKEILGEDVYKAFCKEVASHRWTVSC